MKLSDKQTINADVQSVWTALLNPDALKVCVPGCTEMSGTPDEGFAATVVQKVGPVKATFKGAVTLTNIVEHESLTITGEGKGGPAGFAKGGADVRLEADGDTTILHYDVEAKVGGKLAQLGSRIIDGFAKKMADQFFTNFKDALEDPDQEEEQADADQDDDAPKKGWFKRILSS